MYITSIYLYCTVLYLPKYINIFRVVVSWTLNVNVLYESGNKTNEFWFWIYWFLLGVSYCSGRGMSSLSSDWSLRLRPGLWLAEADPQVPGYPCGRNVSSAHRKLAANIIYRVVMTANNIRQPQTRDISQPQIMGAKKWSNEGCVKT